MNINTNMIKSITRRDLTLYFSNPTGYVFITLFILLSSAAAFQDRFFLNNLANLDQLNIIFPFLLVAFVPALTMNVWSEERRQGTDELLLTLPASDLEIVLGKYLAVVGVYTASLILSIIGQVMVLFFLGSPDLGLMFGNLIGYWFIGCAFIAAGMLASMLSANATISFILGALICTIFVSIENVASILGDGVAKTLAPIGVFDHFGDFSRGVISLSGLVYFISIAATMVYGNILLLGKRHWPQQADGIKMGMHHGIRALAIVIAVISFNVIVGRMSLRLDVTAEQLHSLAPETHDLLDELTDDRPVFIQAYISEEVPQAYVQTRENLVGFLREIDAEAGSRVQVIINDTKPFTDEAKEAREKFGILPREAQQTSGAGTGVVPVYMGVAFTCGAEEAVIPFFDRGLPTQYELMRSVRVVARTDRKKVGVVVNDAKLFGGFDFQAGSTSPAWEVVDELKKQYEVVRIAAASPIEEELDGLVVPMPSTLPQEEMDNVIDYIESGVPSLILVDPLPAVALDIAPSEKSGANRNPFMQQQGPPPKPKGDINGFMSRLGVSWNIGQIVWDAYNPHPDFGSIPPEVVFVGRGNANENSFNEDDDVSRAMQELVFLFPGFINRGSATDVEFTPLLRSGFNSGTQMYQNMVQRHFLFGAQLMTRGLPHYPTGSDYTVAARIKRSMSVDTTTNITNTVKPLNAIVVADLDFVSQQFFEIRKQGVGGLNFDNVSFFLNCIDDLVGDDSFIALRNRRVRHRTLESVEGEIQDNIRRRAQDEQQADSEAQMALGEAQQRLEQKVNEVEQRPDWDRRTKDIMKRNIQEVEQRRFDALRATIEAEKQSKIAASQERMESEIQGIKNRIKTSAILFPPIPALLLGVMIFVRRRRREAESAEAARRTRN